MLLIGVQLQTPFFLSFTPMRVTPRSAAGKILRSMMAFSTMELGSCMLPCCRGQTHVRGYGSSSTASSRTAPIAGLLLCLWSSPSHCSRYHGSLYVAAFNAVMHSAAVDWADSTARLPLSGPPQGAGPPGRGPSSRQNPGSYFRGYFAGNPARPKPPRSTATAAHTPRK